MGKADAISKLTVADEGSVPPQAGNEGLVVQVDVIVAALEEDIVLGRRYPRERLIEEELIQRFRAKRHTIRQALMKLDRMGLIECIPNRGAVVRSYTTEAVEQLYSLRELLEVEAARLIPLPLEPAKLGQIKEVQKAHDLAVKADNLPGIFRANLAFHRYLFGCCNNPFLASAIEVASQRAHGMRFMVLISPKDRESARREHHAIIAALEKSDRDTLIRLCRDHLPPSKRAYLRASASPA